MKKKQFLCVALALCLAFGLTACAGNKTESTLSDVESDNQNGDIGTTDTTSTVPSPNGQEAPLTLADGEAKLIYAKDNYAVAAFHGPDDNISAYFCDADSNKKKDCFGNQRLGNGWTLFISNEFSEAYDYSGIGLSITDYDADKTADGKYQSQDYLNIDQMTDVEMENIGLDFLDGHCCLVGDGGTIYNNNYFGLTFGITWFDDYYFTSFRVIEGFADRFSYFAGDGTPLAEYFDGYSKLEITTMDSMFDIMLIQDGDTGNEEQNKNMCDELRACKPYVVYTGLDGAEQRFDLLTED